jgi:putative ABC transport system permease protein
MPFGALFAEVGRDVRQGLRAMRRSPVFTAAAVLCVALGVGATTTMFTAVHSLFVRTLPFPRAAELVAISARHRGADARTEGVAWADYAAWRGENRSFTNLGVWITGFPTLSGPEGDVERIEGALVSTSLLETVGVTPLLGRTFRASEEERGRADVAVLGFGLWQRRYGGDPGVVGRAVTVDGSPHLVVGVMPPRFDFPAGSQIWIPLAPSPSLRRPGARLRMFALARLQPGVGLAEARNDLARISKRLEAEFPRENAGWEAELQSLRDALVGPLRKPILILLGSAAFVLGIGCANVGNLMLARNASRRHEISIRAALGADRARILRLVLAESLLLALAGCALGTLLALFGVRFLARAFPDGVPSYVDLSVDGTVLAFAASLAVVTALLFGLVPARRAARLDLAPSLREGPAAGHGIAGSRMRSLLVPAEVALSLILVVGATLLIRSNVRFESTLGFRAGGELSFRVPLPSPKYDDARRREFYTELADRVRGLGGVEAVGWTQEIPFGRLAGSTSRTRVSIEGRSAARLEDEPIALRLQTSPDFLRTLGVPLVRGRAFTRSDQETVAPVAIVNEAFARRRFPAEEAVGRRIRFVEEGAAAAPWLTVVGIAANMRHEGVPQALEPAVYVPSVGGSSTFVVRTSFVDPLRLAPAVRAFVRTMDPDRPMYLVQTLEGAVERTLWRERLQGQVLGIFAALALLLTVFGIYGVVSYAVAHRTRELGLRIALGATRRQLLVMVLAQGLRLALLGVAFGVAGALALTRLLTGLLYEIRPTDPATFAGIAVLLGAVAVVAALAPALRAARVDPIVALRCE